MDDLDNRDVWAPLSCEDGRSHASRGSSRDIFSGFCGVRSHVGGLRLLAIVAKLLQRVTCLFVGGLIDASVSQEFVFHKSLLVNEGRISSFATFIR